MTTSQPPNPLSRVSDRGVWPLEGVLLDLGGTLIDETRAFASPDPLRPGVRETLDSLDGRYRLGLLSNSSRTRSELAEYLDEWGISSYFRAIISSADLGLSKPDPRMFEAGWTSLGLDRLRAAMVGDHPDVDIWGAHRAGLRTVYLETIPVPARAKRIPLPEGCVTIRRFPDLPAALRRLEGTAPPPPEPPEPGPEEDNA